jgi:hypothetical protein
MIREEEEPYKLEQFLQLSPVGAPYQWLCQFLIPCVVGTKIWNKKKNKNVLSIIATCSDEAFVLLTLENNYERWMAEANWIVENDEIPEEDRAPKEYPGSKYTNSGKSKKNGRSRRLQGWAREGYLRFNALHALVERDRRHRAEFEHELLAIRQKENANFNRDRIKETLTDAEEEIFPANDLGGLVYPRITGEETESSDTDGNSQ